jgi:PIN domain nuclease of toxin-antitoxin system
VKVLLDTHVFLWAISGDRRLSRAHREIYSSATSELYLSVVSVWEILIKVALGKLPLPAPVAAYISSQMESNRVSSLPIRLPHLIEIETLPPVHRDPFDRMLVAQARAEDIPILTSDPAIRKYNVDVL